MNQNEYQRRTVENLIFQMEVVLHLNTLAMSNTSIPSCTHGQYCLVVSYMLSRLIQKIKI